MAVLPGQTPRSSPAVMLLGKLPPPPSLAGLGAGRGAGRAVGGKPSTPRAQGIACSQGLLCAEPMLRWQWGNSLSPDGHCHLPTEGGRNLALLTRTEGFCKASALVLGLWGCPWHVLSVAAGRQLLVVVSPISKSVCSCPGTSGWLLFSQWQSQVGLFSHTVFPRRLAGVGAAR